MSNEKDERIILADRGRGRDIGHNPTFVGTKPRTRTENRGVPGQLSVGGYGQREETVTSFAGTAVGISGAVGVQTIVGGAGALRGLCVAAFGLSGPLTVLLKAGNVVLIAVNIDATNPVQNVYLGDLGISFNGLTAEIIGSATFTRWVASALIASTE